MTASSSAAASPKRRVPPHSGSSSRLLKRMPTALPPVNSALPMNAASAVRSVPSRTRRTLAGRSSRVAGDTVPWRPGRAGRQDRRMPLSPRRALASGCLATFAALALIPCAAASAGEHVDIRRTAGGVPHVEARSWSGLGYGQGHTYAEDNACTLAEAIVTVNGERSRHFGPDASTQPSGSSPAVKNLGSDFFWRHLKDTGTVDRLLDPSAPNAPTAAARELVAGFAKGYNRVLRDGVDDPRCRGKAWLRPIESIDLWRHYHRLALRASSGAFVTELVATVPPAAGGPVAAGAARVPRPDAGWWTDRLGDANGHRGSNAIAVGRDAAARGAGPGLLLANPHFPWRGEERFYQSHARLRGRLDVQGVALHGLPLPVIGHNRDVAWTHTVSPARRFTPVQLALEPGDPTAYRYAGRLERMTPERVTVEALGAGGKLEPRTHTFWRTRFGLVANLAGGALRWDDKHAYALADANLSNLRIIDTWLDMAKARSVDGLRRAQERHQGIPWVHTVAADSRGVARYADQSVVPHVTKEKIAACLPPGLPQAVFAAARIVTLDGSRAECGWGEDPDAIEPGLFGPRSLPALERTDFVQNSNDSHWLSNPAAPLTGFSPIVGPEGTEQGLRTRLGNDSIARRLAGTDGLGAAGFTVERLQRMLLANRSLAAELVLDDLVALCEANPQITLADGRVVDVAAACPALAGYDRTGDLGARGGWLFTEWFNRAAGRTIPAGFWADRFDPARPLTSPTELNLASPRNVASLGEAVQALRDRGVALDAPFGAVQFGPAGIPIHGCSAGCYQAIYGATAPEAQAARYGEVTDGSSFIMSVELGRRGPRGEAILTYSQSEDPTSRHFADQTKRFAAKRFLPLRFRARDIHADPQLKVERLVVEG